MAVGLSGTRAGKLESILIGGRRFTSVEAIQRFAEKATAAADGDTPPVRTSEQRERAIARPSVRVSGLASRNPDAQKQTPGWMLPAFACPHMEGGLCPLPSLRKRRRSGNGTTDELAETNGNIRLRVNKQNHRCSGETIGRYSGMWPRLASAAGVAADAVASLVLKELVDNALDSAGSCDFKCKGGWLIVQDDGPGLPGTDADIADLFSVARPLSSSKLLRLPTRGALGNGLRVVAGAVLSSGGELIVRTRGRAVRLVASRLDGGTDVELIGPWSGSGTRVEVLLGESLPVDEDTFTWARRAKDLANVAGAKSYPGKTSAWWYDSDSFFELLQAAGIRTVRELVTDFAGCSRSKAAITDDFGKGYAANCALATDSDRLLRQLAKRCPARDAQSTRPRRARVSAGWGLCSSCPARLKLLSPRLFVGRRSLCRGGMGGAGGFPVHRGQRQPDAHNRGSEYDPRHGGQDFVRAIRLRTFQSAREHGHKYQGRPRAEYCVVVNITTPYMPITSDGKAPDLSKITRALKDAVEKAIRAAKRKLPENKSENNALPRRKRAARAPKPWQHTRPSVEQFAQRYSPNPITIGFSAIRPRIWLHPRE